MVVRWREVDKFEIYCGNLVKSIGDVLGVGIKIGGEIKDD